MTLCLAHTYVNSVSHKLHASILCPCMRPDDCVSLCVLLRGEAAGVQWLLSVLLRATEKGTQWTATRGSLTDIDRGRGFLQHWRPLSCVGQQRYSTCGFIQLKIFCAVAAVHRMCSGAASPHCFPKERNPPPQNNKTKQESEIQVLIITYKYLEVNE